MRMTFIIFIFLFSSAFSQSIHPNFALVDQDSVNVIQSGRPISTLKTCGGCHDTDYITRHSTHSDVGFSSLVAPGSTATERPWDISPGLYGRWNPMVYRYLSPPGDERIDLDRRAWIQIFGARHVGGGPAVEEMEGEGVEMNCFLCHTDNPDNQARIKSLSAGQLIWANTATLAGSGIVSEIEGGWRYQPTAFDRNGEVKPEFLIPIDPTNENCGLCHGLVHTDRQAPLVTSTCEPEYWMTETTGQIISPQRLSDSGLNLANKTELYRSWDIHAERVITCTNCHYSLNNPVYFREPKETRPAHLTFSPRRLSIGEYLVQPNHQFARGTSSYRGLSPELMGTMRRCESCHTFEATHDWLPYRKRHIQAMTCESCHVPYLYAPARRVMDWTVITPDGKPRIECRGFSGKPMDIRTLVTGYEPVLLSRIELDGSLRLSPYNMVTFWYWTYGDPVRPVRLADLKQALILDGDYHPDIKVVLDDNQNGEIESEECILNDDAKYTAVKQRLEAIGLSNIEIRGEIQPFGIHHTVSNGEWVTRDCEACHSGQSKVSRTFLLAKNIPNAVMPILVGDASIASTGMLFTKDNKLYYQENLRRAGFFIIGHNRNSIVQIIGAASVMLILMAIGIHGILRIIAARKRKTHHRSVRVYMYAMYERFWHWLQALAIVGLIFTGLIIHAPNVFGVFAFDAAVYIHNGLAFILVVNAFLAVFYHFTSGAIKRFLPQPHGFFSQAVQQTTYYLKGIFKGEPHPFEKNPEVRLNPLQKIVYLAILNILLPLQIITGGLIWAAQHFPKFLAEIGGLGTLVPIHSLIAWFFAAFLIVHIYLTTTGYTPLAAIKAMITGWEEVEVHKET